MRFFQRFFSSGPSIDDLHENYAKQGRIDEHAATKSKASLVVNAPIAKVWNLLIQPDKWYKFYPSFRNVKFTPPPQVDDKFSFTFNGIMLHERFSVVEKEKELTWTGTVLWLKSIDRHILTAIDSQTTRVTIEESLSGVMAPFIKSSASLKVSHEEWLAAFKRGVEES